MQEEPQMLEILEREIQGYRLGIKPSTSILYQNNRNENDNDISDAFSKTLGNACREHHCVQGK